jgi:hypothetical protein
MFVSYDFEHYGPYIHAERAKRPHLLDQFLNAKADHSTKLHVAVLVKRGRVLAFATNKVASRSSGASSRGSQNFIHAEKNLLRAIGDLSRMKGSDVYVMRISPVSSTGFMYSQPCSECTAILNKCIEKHGLRKVFFTTSPT